MKIKNLIISLSAIVLLNGCSVRIGGSSESATDNKIVYDCSVISDQAHKELTKRRAVCGTGTTVFDKSCRQEATASVCKPVVSDK